MNPGQTGSESSLGANAAKENSTPDQGNTQQANQGDKNQEINDLQMKLDQIAKRDRFLTQRERKIAESERAFREREESLKSAYGKYEEIGSIKNPVKVLEKLGYSIDDILEATLSDDNDYEGKKSSREDPEVVSLKSKIKELETRYQKDAEDRKKEDEERQVSYQKHILQNMIGSEQDRWPYVNELGKEGIDQIWNQIYSHLQETGEVLDYGKVIDSVEDTARDYIRRFSKINRFADDMGLSKLEQKLNENKSQQNNFEDKRATKEFDFSWESNNTLTNGSESDGRISESYDSMDEEELLRKAAAMIKWNTTE